MDSVAPLNQYGPQQEAGACYCQKCGIMIYSGDLCLDCAGFLGLPCASNSSFDCGYDIAD